MAQRLKVSACNVGVREDPLEKEMATHSSILAWRTPWTEEPGGLQSIGLQRVGHNWVTSLTMLSASCEMPGLMKHKLELRLLGEISTT